MDLLAAGDCSSTTACLLWPYDQAQQASLGYKEAQERLRRQGCQTGVMSCCDARAGLLQLHPAWKPLSLRLQSLDSAGNSVG